MRSILVGCLILAACAGTDEEPGEGDHLVVHVTCTQPFDDMLVTLSSDEPTDVPTGLTQHYDWDYWETFTGDGPRGVSITVLANGNAVATGMASQIVYLDQPDGTRLAEIAMPLTP